MAIVAVVVVLVAVAAGAGGYGIYLKRTSHTLSTPPVAGGLTLDTGTEAGVDKAVDKLIGIIEFATGRDVGGFVSGVYTAGRDKYLFVGGTGEHDLTEHPEAMFSSAIQTQFRDGNGTIYRPSTFKLQDAGGDGIALMASVYMQTERPSGSNNATFTMAAWSTRTTMAIVMPIADDVETGNPLRTVLLDIRAGVED